MEKHTIATKALSRFLQLFDGNFPSGAFVHSFGLEPHIVSAKVQTIEDLDIYLNNLITYQYEGNDFVFISKIYKALENNNLRVLIKEDNNYSAMQSYEFAKASSDIGANYLKQIGSLFQIDIAKEYLKAIKKSKAFGNELAILSIYAYELGLEKDFFTLMWCKKNIITIATTSLKISRIKPSEIQQMLFSYDEKLEAMIQNQSKSYNSFNPLFEEVIYQHKSLEPKLFTT